MFNNVHTHIIYSFSYIYIYIYICVCVCVCVCVCKYMYKNTRKHIPLHVLTCRFFFINHYS